MTNSSKKRILVTGGLGFIGSHLVRRLRGAYDIMVIDYDDSSSARGIAAEWKKSGIQVWHNNIADFNMWDNIEPCDFIFHGAAQTAAVKSEKEPFDDFRSNALGTIRIAEFARKNNAGVIYCNTMRVYDSAFVDDLWYENKAVSEDCPTVWGLSNNTSPFAFSKYIGEQYLQWYSQKYGIKVISNRMSGVVGPDQRSSEVHGWVSYIVKCAVDGEQYEIFGDGNQTRDILYIDDFVDLIEAELSNFRHFSENGFAVYNIGGGHKNELSINQVIKILKKDYGLKLEYENGDPRLGEPRHYYSDLGKIRQKGWPLKNLKSAEEIINKVVNYYRSSGDS